MIKVLYIIDTLEMGGAEKSLVEITSHFSNIEPVFIHIYEGDTQSEKLKIAGIRVIALNLPEKYGFGKAVSKIIPIIREEKPDIIHSTLYRSDMITRKLKSKVAVPIVNSFVSNSYSNSRFEKLSFDKKIKLKLIQYLDRVSTSNVDLFVSNSYTIKRDNAKALNVDENKIIVIPRGRSPENYHFNATEIKNYKKKLGFESKKIFLSVGRLIKSKGHLDLIIAFSKIKKKNPDTILLIAGEGSYRKVLEAKILELNLKDHVWLLGNRNDVPKLLAISDIFIFPTYLEGMPGSLIEAMFSKIHIISSNIKENQECLPQFFNRYFKPGDINSLSNLMESSVQNLEGEKEQEKMKIYQFAVQNYSLTKIVEKYEEIYSNLLKNNSIQTTSEF